MPQSGGNLSAKSPYILTAPWLTRESVVRQGAVLDMRRASISKVLFQYCAVISVACATLGGAYAVGPDTASVPPADPAPCLAAISANDDEKIVGECGALIDNEKTAKSDRLKALIARARVFTRKEQLERAIADYDVALRLDPAQADLLDSRGELWWKKGDRPKALADFGAAIKANPDHPTARGNYKRLAQELERLGALMAVAGKPSFNCATARRPVEKAICANPELANLDRQINAVNTKVVRDATADSPRAGRALQQEQDAFLSQRNASFGRPDYDLQKAMRERLDHLLTIERQ
jgi:tetratricopeptide (TPR) repeat protein